MDKPTEPSSTDVSIDMTAKHLIPSQNPSPIYLQQVLEDSIVSLENEDTANAGSSHVYYQSLVIIVLADIFAVGSSVWIGFVSEKWFTLSEDEKFGSSLWETATWNYDTLTGALNHGKITYAHDPICTNNDITLGFGVTISKEGHSVFYVKDDEPAKEIVSHGASVDDLYPAICLRQPNTTNLSINSMGPFKYKGRERLPNPHKTPIGSFECSPDRRYAAVFSVGDEILSLWRLYDEPLPKLVSHIAVPELIVNGIDASEDSTERYSHKLITLAVSNTTGNDLPVLALSRYHARLPPGTSRIFFLSYASSKHYQVQPNKISGCIHILDDGDTLLILNATHLFVMSMKSRALLRTFNRNDLSISMAVPSIRPHITPSVGADRPLKPFGRSHFIWHYDADHVTMWSVSTGRLEQSFRLTFKAGEMYDYDKAHNLVAFYGIDGLRIFTVQTGIRICEAERSEMRTIVVVAAKFVTIDDTLHLVTMDGDEDKYIIRIWNPLNGTIIKEVTSAHSFSERFTYSYQDIKMDQQLVKLVTPLMATVASFTVDMLLPRRNETLHSEDLHIEDPSECVEFEGESSRPTKPRLEIIKRQTELTKYLIRVIGFRKHPAIIEPEPWNDRPLMPCYWISENLFLVVGRHSVQIIDATVASPTKIGIKFAWCLPFHDATIDKICLMRNDDKVLRQIVIDYEHKGKHDKDIVAVDVENLSISPKHASRFLQFAGLEYTRSAAAYEHRVVLEQVLKSPKDALLLNKIEVDTMTSPVGHIIRGPPNDAIRRLGLLFESRTFRPLFYDHMHWNKSVLRDALDTQRFDMVTDIVKYCLQSVYTNRDFTTKSRELELGYVAIILEALPAISRVKPLMATWIVQYLSNVPPSRFIQYHEVEYDSRESRFQVFARVEQLSNVDGLYFAMHNIVYKFPPLKWLRDQYAWYSENAQPRSVRLCLSPLYGINRYSSDGLHFRLSVFAQLAFRQSSLFEEPAFGAFVQYKWNTFGRQYFLGFILVHISYSLLYLIAISISPYTFVDYPALKYTQLVISIALFFIFDILPLWVLWRSQIYWSSIYHWSDCTAFVMVFVSTILTSRDYDRSVELQAWTVLALWLCILFSFRVHDGLGLIFTLMIEIIRSIRWLLVFMATILFAFAQAMWILLHNTPRPNGDGSNPFQSFDGSLNALWEFLGGDFGLIDSWEVERSLNIMRILFTFFTTIMLLNILIAILNNKYESTRIKAQITLNRHRAEFIAMVETFFLTSAQQQNKHWFPDILFYEVSPDDLDRYERTVMKKHPWISRDENE